MNIPSHFKRAPMARLAVGVVLSAIGFSCIEMPLEPILPASDVPLSLPLIDRTRTIADLFSKDTSKVKQDAAGYYYQDDRIFNSTQINPLTLTPQALSQQASVGSLTIPGIPSATQSFNVGALGIPTTTVPNGITLPGSSATIPSSQIDQSSQIGFVVIKGGSLTLTVTNNLPVSISFPGPITLKNNKTTSPVDTNVIATFNFPTIPKRSSNSQTSILSGKTLRGLLKTDPVNINTGSLTGPDTIKSTDGVSFTFGTSSIQTDTVSAVIPDQTLSSFTDSVITIDSSAVLQQATFKQGQFTLNIDNQTGLTVGARLKFNNFVSTKPSLDTLIVNRLIAPHTNFPLSVTLDTLQIVNGDLSRPGSTMKFSVQITTVNSGGTIPTSTITSGDYVKASFTPQQTFVLKSLTGIMNPMTLAINQGVTLAGLGQANKDFAGSFSFDSIQLDVKIKLSGGFPVFHNLTLYAKKFSSPTLDSLNVPSGTVVPNTTGVIALGNAQGLSTFLGKETSSFPDTMFLRGYVVVNPNTGSGTIYDTTKVYPSVSTIIPLKLGLLGGQYADVIGIGGEKDSSFSKDVKSGTLYFSITNGLPIALQFRAAFMRYDSVTHKPDTLLRMPQSGGGNTYSISGATVDASGAVPVGTGPKTSSLQFSLVTDEVKRLLASDSVYVLLKINTSGANTSTTAQPVRIRSTDAITIRASASLVYTANKK